MIARQGLERLQQRTNFLRRIFFLQRLIEFPDQIAKANRVLLIAGMMPVRGLIKREARRLVSA